MAEQLWGSYSVADHCTAFPFVADMVLYDRLIVPVPPADEDAEWQRWTDNKWNPARQRLLLDELGDYVRRVPWTKDLRDKWVRMGDRPSQATGEPQPEAEDTSNFVAGDLEMTARGEREVRQKRHDPFGDTRRLIARQEGSALLDGADARVLAVYGTPDRFDRRFRFTRVFPFLTRETIVQRGNDRDFLPGDVDAQEQLLRYHELATLIVGQFVLPVADDEPGTEMDDARALEVLLRARDLLNDPHIAPKRAAFRAWVARYEPLQLPDSRKVKEFDELLTAYNSAVRDRRRASRVETGALVLGTAALGASVFVPGADKVGDAVGAIGTAATRWSQPGEWLPGDIAAGALIREAQKATRKK